MANPNDDYRILPDGVASVLDAVEGATERLVATYDEMSGPVGAASGAAGSSGIVTGALAEVLTWLVDRADIMTSIVDLATNAVSEAVDAYAKGDQQMAATIVGRMTTALDEELAAGGGH
jgi:hypothetical protein